MVSSKAWAVPTSPMLSPDTNRARAVGTEWCFGFHNHQWRQSTANTMSPINFATGGGRPNYAVSIALGMGADYNQDRDRWCLRPAGWQLNGPPPWWRRAFLDWLVR